MAIPKKNIRGLQDIRTKFGRCGPGYDPYMAYMKISCLEMEKLRRNKEKESALHRVKVIDERLAEIEAEKAAILQNLAENGGSSCPSGCEPEPRREPGSKGSGFIIRY